MRDKYNVKGAQRNAPKPDNSFRKISSILIIFSIFCVVLTILLLANYTKNNDKSKKATNSSAFDRLHGDHHNHHHHPTSPRSSHHPPYQQRGGQYKLDDEDIEVGPPNATGIKTKHKTEKLKPIIKQNSESEDEEQKVGQQQDSSEENIFGTKNVFWRPAKTVYHPLERDYDDFLSKLASESIDVKTGLNEESSTVNYSPPPINRIATSFLITTPNPITISTTSFIKNKPTMQRTSQSYNLPVAQNSSTPMRRIEKIISCPKPDPVCETISCKKSVSKMLSLMDHDHDPCDDFYLYSCDGLRDNHISNRDRYEEIINSMSDIREMKIDKNCKEIYQKFYETCHDFKCDGKIDPVVRLFKQLYESIPSGSKMESLTNLIGNILLSHPHRSTSRLLPLFDVVLDIGPNNKFVPMITLPMFPAVMQDSDSGDYYEKNCLLDTDIFGKTAANADKIYEFYKNCLANQTRYIGMLEEAIPKLQLFSDLDDFKKEQKIKETISFIEWEIVDPDDGFGFLTINEKIEKYRHKHENATYLQLSGLNVKYPQIDWNKLFNKLFGNKMVSFDKIKILFPEYLERIFKFYQEKTYEEIRSSLLAMISHDWYLDFVRPIISTDRKLYCRKLSNKLMEDVASKIYSTTVDKDSLELAEKTTSDLFNQISQKLSDTFERATWLNADEKGAIIRRNEKIKIVSNAGKTISDDWLANRMEGIKMTNDFVTNVVILKKRVRTLMYDLHDEPADNLEHVWTYLVSPFSATIQTILPINYIVVPYGMLKEFTVNKENMAQKYELFAKLGFFIGHELLHFFDPFNMKSVLGGDNEQFKNFVDNQLATHKQITQIDNKYKLSFTNEDIVSSLTSRFADDASIRLALETYNTFNVPLITSDLPFLWLNFSVPQIYFLTLAQQFCDLESSRGRVAIDLYEKSDMVNYFRVNSMIMNSKNFAGIFDCPLGSTMNPNIKVDQFPHIAQMDYYD